MDGIGVLERSKFGAEKAQVLYSEKFIIREATFASNRRGEKSANFRPDFQLLSREVLGRIAKP
jgi:hypothetical protein